jgi:hypothetical protein
MQEIETIKRRNVLIEMETGETRGYNIVTFSIQFYKKNGELVSLIRAKATGLRANMTKNRLRGVQAVDYKGNTIGHIYPVCIDNIRMFNGKRICL